MIVMQFRHDRMSSDAHSNGWRQPWSERKGHIVANPGRANSFDAEDDRLAAKYDAPTSEPVYESVAGAREQVPVEPPKREFTDRVSTADEFEKMPKEYRDLLTRVLRIQADCEIGGPHLYVSNWVLTAPTADDQWRMSRIAAEEVDHFRKINRLLKLIGSSADDRLWVDKEERYVDAFKSEMPSWADIAVFGMLIDRVGEYQLDEFVDCSFEPLNKVLPPILQEEKGHVSYGLYKCRDLIDQGRQEDVQEAIDRWYPEALDMFGNAQSKRADKYIKWGLKRRTNEQARQQYIAEVEPLLRELGLVVPDRYQNRDHV
jgi:ring-1,2-phenylacetyl-CoA epoxidase subunit PaaA